MPEIHTSSLRKSDFAMLRKGVGRGGEKEQESEYRG